MALRKSEKIVITGESYITRQVSEGIDEPITVDTTLATYSATIDSIKPKNVIIQKSLREGYRENMALVDSEYAEFENYVFEKADSLKTEE